MKPLKSSNLKAAAYDAATKTLTIEFSSGVPWTYVGVPEKHHAGLFEAESPGSYFHRHIRGNPDYTASPVKDKEED